MTIPDNASSERVAETVGFRREGLLRRYFDQRGTELRRRGRRERKSMGKVASELLAQALTEPDERPIEPFRWTAADLGAPLVELEDEEAVSAVLDARS